MGKKHSSLSFLEKTIILGGTGIAGLATGYMINKNKQEFSRINDYAPELAAGAAFIGKTAITSIYGLARVQKLSKIANYEANNVLIFLTIATLGYYASAIDESIQNFMLNIF